MKKNKRVSIVHYNKRLPLKQLDVVVGSLPNDYPHMSEQRKYILEKQLTRDHNQNVESKDELIRYVIDQDDNRYVYELSGFNLTALALDIVGVDKFQKMLAIKKPDNYDLMYEWNKVPEHEIYVDENGEERLRPIKRPDHSKYKSGTSTLEIRKQFGFRL